MGEILKMSTQEQVINRINDVFDQKKDILNVYFTAGYPMFDDTIRIARNLQNAGADMLEIGIPFSDPLADGTTIQESSSKALANGMTIHKLLDELKDLRKYIELPVLMMGYLNPILQFGVNPFCEACECVEIDGLIIPDLPIEEYIDNYKEIFTAHGIHNIFLISPNTSEERIRQIDEWSDGFIYMVSSSSITGAKKGLESKQLSYFNRIDQMNLKNARLIGFGISDHVSFSQACRYAHGAIIGSAFINQLKNDASEKAIKNFVTSIKK
ncbi:MAG: tryptophan synthase subunit alpha [Ekhidna sp.]|nr:tryptophan synthase subunit alpha [Ekhidna sp.]